MTIEPNDNGGASIPPHDPGAESAFDELGRRAGQALRRPAPEHGASDIARRGRLAQRVRTVAATGAAVVILVGGIALLTRDDRSTTITPGDTVAPDTTVLTPLPATTGALTEPTTTTAPSRPAVTSTTLPTGSTVPASVPAPGTVTVTDPSITLTPFGVIDEPAEGVAYSADGATLVTVGADRVFRFYDARTLVKLRELDCPLIGAPLPDLWDDEARQLATAATIGAAATSLGGSTNPCPVSFNLDGTRAVNGQSLWNTVDGTMTVLAGGGAVMSPDGTTVLTSSREDARLWDARTGALLIELDSSSGEIYPKGGHFSSDGRRIVTFAPDARAMIWDSETYVKVATLEGPTAYEVRFTPDGSRVVATTSEVVGPRTVGGASIWDATTGEELLHVVSDDGNSFLGVAGTNNDGSLVAICARDGTLLYDGATGSNLAMVPRAGGTDTWTVAFSPGGTSLAISGPTGVEVFDILR
ncbi:MAG: hypothetical protein Q7V88_00570 [Actinomycetota bacterium]|nr:hypothetical protein [Actinomycetota bacterium]